MTRPLLLTCLLALTVSSYATDKHLLNSEKAQATNNLHVSQAILQENSKSAAQQNTARNHDNAPAHKEQSRKGTTLSGKSLSLNTITLLPSR